MKRDDAGRVAGWRPRRRRVAGRRIRRTSQGDLEEREPLSVNDLIEHECSWIICDGAELRGHREMLAARPGSIYVCSVVLVELILRGGP